MSNVEYHFAPDFLSLLVDTIPRLNKGKADVMVFFRGAGVSTQYLDDLDADLKRNKASHNKYDLARTVLIRLNEAGDATLAARREVVRRIVHFEDFTRCWEADVLQAKGLVSEVQRLVNVKDSFTRMNQERERERSTIRAAVEADIAAKRNWQNNLDSIKAELFGLFGEVDANKRGKALEGVLNRLFSFYGISVREAFTVRHDDAGIVEQIDGAIDLGGHLYLVEMKWHKDPLGVDKTSQHLVRVFSRDGARGLFISASGYSQPSIAQYIEALGKKVVVMVTLEEIVKILNQSGDLKAVLDLKVQAAILDKKPFANVFYP